LGKSYQLQSVTRSFSATVPTFKNVFTDCGIANPERIIGAKVQKSYKYGVEEAEKKFAEWDRLMRQLFVRRK
jgi:hypothetical protein